MSSARVTAVEGGGDGEGWCGFGVACLVEGSHCLSSAETNPPASRILYMNGNPSTCCNPIPYAPISRTQGKYQELYTHMETFNSRTSANLKRNRYVHTDKNQQPPLNQLPVCREMRSPHCVWVGGFTVSELRH